MLVKRKEIKNNRLSKFWSKSNLDNINVDKFKTYISGNTNSIKRLHELSQLKNGISNFVRIIGGKSIPVEFATSNKSYTDFERVVISSAIDQDNFDIMCGLAMHEGSHIKYTNPRTIMSVMGITADTLKKQKTDFTSIARLYDEMFDDEAKQLAIDKKYMPDCSYNEIKKEDEKFYAAIMNYLMIFVKDMNNWVEDKRIDRIVYDSAPGYKGYYDALYNYYFLNDSIDEGLKSANLRTEEFNSYEFRIVNSVNENSDENALKGLSEILSLIDIDNIDRLENTADAFELSFKIYKIILKNVTDLDKEKIEEMMKEKQKGEGEGEGEKGEGEGDEGDEIDYENLDLSDIEFGDGGADGKGKSLDLDKLSDKQLEDLKKALEKQKEFLDGQTEKEKLGDSDNENIKAIANKSISIVPVDSEEQNKTKDTIYKRQKMDSKYDNAVYDVVVLNNVNSDTFFNRNIFPFSTSYEQYSDRVQSGFRAGKKLGGKLLIRNDERITEYSRKRSGNIDKRLLSDLAWGSESIFTQRMLESYTNSIMHLSIDGSGSMSGSKLGQCVYLATTIAVAADMIDNLEVVVSLRGTRDYDPFVAIIYDSRKDKLKKIKDLFPYLCVSGYTPEGLCFGAIQEQIEKTSGTMKSYFINLSDGAPYFNNYHGYLAQQHTRHEVHKMELKNVRILSYYIEENSYYSGYRHEFEAMYGKFSSYVDVENIGQISKTLNKLFLEKT